jgi:hypothetical protein
MAVYHCSQCYNLKTLGHKPGVFLCLKLFSLPDKTIIDGNALPYYSYITATGLARSEKRIRAMIMKTTMNLAQNKIIVDFCFSQACEKVAAEMKEQIGSSATGKAVAILALRYPNIQDRVNTYALSALAGCVAKALTPSNKPAGLFN